MEKMYLIWVCKSVKEFSWVLNTVHEVEKEVSITFWLGNSITVPPLTAVAFIFNLQLNILIITFIQFQLLENKVSDLLEVHLFVTREKDEKNSGKLPTWHVGSLDTWTPGKVNYGRPNFRQEIAKKVESHKE